ncbi:monocarboxylate transporter 12-like isoform X1 [Amblyomma americanum]
MAFSLERHQWKWITAGCLWTPAEKEHLRGLVQPPDEQELKQQTTSAGPSVTSGRGDNASGEESRPARLARVLARGGLCGRLRFLLHDPGEDRIRHLRRLHGHAAAEQTGRILATQHIARALAAGWARVRPALPVAIREDHSDRGCPALLRAHHGVRIRIQPRRHQRALRSALRGTALGLLFIVTAVSGFVSPMALEFLRQTYGFRCTLFLVGAIILNMLLGCFIVSRIERTEAVDDPHVPTKTKELLAEPPRVLADRRRSSFQAASLGQSCSIALAESIMSLDKGDRSARAKLLRSLRSLLSLAFIHIGVSRAAALFALTTILITVVDFGEDNGLTGYDAVSLLTAYAIGDLGSRLCTALVLDTRFLSSSATLLCMFALQTAVMAVMSFEKNYWVLLSCCFVTGLSSGGRVFTCTVMVAEEFDEDSISLNLGVMNFVSGFACLIRPPVIGYCRDVLGSYTTLYMLLAIINAVFTVTWSLKVVLSKRKKVPPLRDVLQELPDARGRIGSITSF